MRLFFALYVILPASLLLLPILAVAQQPMSCLIAGKIVRVDKKQKANEPFVAKVIIQHSGPCGSSVSASHNAGDTLMLHFIVQNLSSPLKRGDVIQAECSVHLKPGSDGEWWAYTYTQLKTRLKPQPRYKALQHKP
jgi:hypothetical protein